MKRLRHFAFLGLLGVVLTILIKIPLVPITYFVYRDLGGYVNYIVAGMVGIFYVLETKKRFPLKLAALTTLFWELLNFLPIFLISILAFGPLFQSGQSYFNYMLLALVKSLIRALFIFLIIIVSANLYFNNSSRNTFFMKKLHTLVKKDKVFKIFVACSIILYLFIYLFLMIGYKLSI